MKKVFDASGFPLITSSLRFTNSESMCAEEPHCHFLGAAVPGLQIHYRRRKGLRSDLLKVPNIISSQRQTNTVTITTQ